MNLRYLNIKNMRKILLLVAVLFLSPSIVLASWWSPVSWFSKTNGNTVDKIDVSTSTGYISTSTLKEGSESVDDSSLQKKIDALTRENGGLKYQLNLAVNDLNMCKNQKAVSAVPQPTVSNVSVSVRPPVDSKEVKLKSLDSESLKLVSELEGKISSYDISASVRTSEIEDINILVGKIDSVLVSYRYIDGSKMVCGDITPIAARTPDVSIYPFSKVAVAEALPNMSKQIGILSACLDFYIQNRNYVSVNSVIQISPEPSSAGSLNSAQVRVDSVQQINDVKAKYYKDVQDIISNPNYSGSVRSGKINALIDEANLQLQRLDPNIKKLIVGEGWGN